MPYRTFTPFDCARCFERVSTADTDPRPNITRRLCRLCDAARKTAAAKGLTLEEYDLSKGRIPGRHPSIYRCSGCGEIRQAASRRLPKLCEECNPSYRRKRAEHEGRHTPIGSELECPVCRRSFVKATARQNHCSLPCSRLSESRRGHAKRGRRRAGVRRLIVERDAGRCQLCDVEVVWGDPFDPRAGEIDHVFPVSKWPKGLPGKNDPANLQLLCRSCNLAKSDTIPERMIHAS